MIPLKPRPSRTRRLRAVVIRVRRYAGRPWYPPAIAALAAADIFVGFIPTDWLLISSVMLRPKRWVQLALIVAAGSALGTAALSAVVGHLGPTLLAFIAKETPTAAWWTRLMAILVEHAPLVLGLVAASPLPLPPAVLVAAFAGANPLSISLAVLLGRTPKYLFFAWSATHAPYLLRLRR